MIILAGILSALFAMLIARALLKRAVRLSDEEQARITASRALRDEAMMAYHLRSRL